MGGLFRIGELNSELANSELAGSINSIHQSTNQFTNPPTHQPNSPIHQFTNSQLHAAHPAAQAPI
jgi:hypothetical protein